MSEKTFYLEQAAVCADAANGATLENERNKFRAAEKAWRGLADSAEKRASRWLRDGLGS